MIGSNQLHTLESISERCLYYCLIIDKRLCEERNSRWMACGFRQRQPTRRR